MNKSTHTYYNYFTKDTSINIDTENNMTNIDVDVDVDANLNTSTKVSFSIIMLMNILLFALLSSLLTISNAIGQAMQELPAEKMIFDLYVSGNPYGSIPVTYTDNWVEVEDPSSIADRIKNVADNSAFKELFTDRLYSGTGKTITNVGSVTVEPFLFRINVTIDQAQASLQNGAIQKEEHLIPSQNLSLQNNFTITGATDFDPNTPYDGALNHATTLSKGRWRGSFNGNLTKGETYDADTASIAHDVGNGTYEAGMLTTRGANSYSGLAIYGVSYFSNQRYRSHDTPRVATPIEIFVPSNGAKVSVFRKETQIIAARTLNFGLQEFDTKRFPDGSYEIKIVIEENDGAISEERRSFIKATEIRPFGTPEYNIQAGVIRDNDTALDKAILQAGIEWRFNDYIELESNFAIDDNIFLYEQGLKGVWNAYNFDGALSLSSKGDSELTTHISYGRKKNKGIRWNVNTQHTISGHDDNDIVNEPLSLASSVSGKRSLISGNIGFNHKDFNFGFSGTSNRSSDGTRTYSYGPNIGWNMINNRYHTLRATVNYNKTSNGIVSSALANYRWSPNSNWAVNSGLGRQHINHKTAFSTANSLHYNKPTSSGGEIAVSLRNQTALSGSSDFNATDLNTIVRGKHVSVRTDAKYSNTNGQPSKKSLNMEAESNMLLSRDARTGKVGDITFVGGDNSNASGATLLVHVNGNAIGESMNVLVNGNPKGIVKVGDSIAVKLPAYGKHRVSLAPSGAGALLDFSDEVKEITLFPSNVSEHSWTVNKSLLVLGRVLDMNGNPITWQTIRGLKDFGTTDGTGNFQMDITGNEAPFIKSGKHTCTFALPTIDTNEYFVNIGDIVCG